LSSYDAYNLEKLIHDTVEDKPPYRKYLIPLALVSILAIILGLINSVYFFILLPVFTINVVLHLKNKANITYYLEAINQLDVAITVAKKLAGFKPLRNAISDINFLKEVAKIQSKTKFISFEKQLSNEFVVFLWYLVEMVKIQFNFEAILYYRFIDTVLAQRKSIDALFVFIGEIDCAISTASVKSSDLQTCKPDFNSDNKIEFVDILHPLVKNCVPNNLELIHKSLLLTGSNMSGKTTFIRTSAINSLLAQTLNIAFAKKFSAPFYKIFTSITISDDLKNNTSYYLKEVLTIKEFIAFSKENVPCLFVLDEIFKGTNTLERISGGAAILSFLNKENNLVMVSTHDIELADLLENDNYKLYHFSEKIQDDELIFDHKLKSGKLKTTNAIKILELYGYPKEIIKHAKSVRKEFSPKN